MTFRAEYRIQTDKKLPDSKRLLEIYNDLTTVVQKYQPDCASVEELFFFKNQKTIIPVAEARGVILTVLEKLNIPTYSYTPIPISFFMKNLFFIIYVPDL